MLGPDFDSRFSHFDCRHRRQGITRGDATSGSDGLRFGQGDAPAKVRKKSLQLPPTRPLIFGQ